MHVNFSKLTQLKLDVMHRYESIRHMINKILDETWDSAFLEYDQFVEVLISQWRAISSDFLSISGLYVCSETRIPLLSLLFDDCCATEFWLFTMHWWILSQLALIYHLGVMNKGNKLIPDAFKIFCLDENIKDFLVDICLWFAENNANNIVDLIDQVFFIEFLRGIVNLIDVFFELFRWVFVLNAQDPFSELDGPGNLFYVAGECFEEDFVRVVVCIFEIPWNLVLGD